MNSLPTTEAANLERYWEIIRKLDPELYLIKLALKETGVNPMIIPRFIRQIANLTLGTGYGKIIIYIQKKIVTNIEGLESDKLDEPTLVDKE